MHLGPNQKILILILLGCLGLIIFWLLDEYHVLSAIQDGAQIRLLVESYGTVGPILIIF